MNRIFKSLALTAASFALLTSAFAEEKVVNIYNWSDYIDESILADFTKETDRKSVV